MVQTLADQLLERLRDPRIDTMADMYFDTGFQQSTPKWFELFHEYIKGEGFMLAGKSVELPMKEPSIVRQAVAGLLADKPMLFQKLYNMIMAVIA